MNVLVDTSVWSLALRRSVLNQSPEVRELAELIAEGRVIMIGAIRQELLSGIKTVEQFKKLRDALRAFPDLSIASDEYERAAQNYNRCRTVGVQGSNTDFVMCAVAMSRNAAIFTLDKDFDAIGRVLKFKRHSPRK